MDDAARIIRTLCPLIMNDDDARNPSKVRMMYMLRLKRYGITAREGITTDAYPCTLEGSGYYMQAQIADENGDMVVYLGKIYKETSDNVWDSDSIEVIG